MADPRFFRNAGPFALGELAQRIGADLAAPGAADFAVADVAPLDRAGPQDLTFFDNPKYAAALAATRAGVVVLAPEAAGKAPEGARLLLCKQPYRAYALAAQAFYPPPPPQPGIHPSAVVAPDAVVYPSAQIGPGAVIESGAEVGNSTLIGPNAVIGRNVRVGRDCRIGALVSLSHCEVGDRVTIHPGAKIGQDGFGFAPDPRGHVKVPQLGRVLVGDDCEIGANTTIDRGAGPDTVIGAGCWIDNLVQIGHNVTLGRGCIVVAQSGVAGSTRVGNFVALGAQAGLVGHIVIGDGAQIAAQSGVMNDVPAGETWCGSPAMPIKQFFRQVAAMRRLVQGKETRT